MAAVDPILELGEVARHVLRRDRAVGAGDRGLYVAECGVDPLEGWGTCRPRARTGLDDRVLAAGFGDSGEAGQAVADHLAGPLQTALGETFEGAAAEARYPAQLQPHRPAL